MGKTKNKTPKKVANNKHKNTPNKNGKFIKSKKSPLSRLNISHTKYSEEFKAKARLRLFKWKETKKLQDRYAQFQLAQQAKVLAARKASAQITEDSSDDDSSETNSDIEIIETIPDIVVLDDEEDVGIPAVDENKTEVAVPDETAGATRSDSFSHEDTDADVLALHRDLEISAMACEPDGEEPPPPGTSQAIVILPTTAAKDTETETIDQYPSAAGAAEPTTKPPQPTVSLPNDVNVCAPNVAVDEPMLFYDDKHGSIDHPHVSHVAEYGPTPDNSFMGRRTPLHQQRPPAVAMSASLETDPVSDDSFNCCDRTITEKDSLDFISLDDTSVKRPAKQVASADIINMDDPTRRTPLPPPVSAISASLEMDPVSDDSFICDRTLTETDGPDFISLTDTEKPAKKPASTKIINLDDTIFASPSPRRRQRKRKAKAAAVDDDDEDSVIFVSETMSTKPTQESTSLMPKISRRQAIKAKLLAARKQGGWTLNPVKWGGVVAQQGPSTKAQNPRVFQRTVVNNRTPPVAPEIVCNTYNPSKVDITKPAKRMVIIDGSNVAFSHSPNRMFSVRGLAICIEFFEREGHVVKAVVPQMRLKTNMSTDPVMLEMLHKQGKVVLTPCKNLPGHNAISYDDRFIMDLASEFDAAVISNDNYRDLFHENEKKTREIIQSRVIGYTWCMDMILFPKDPYGRDGPTLHDILNRKGVVPDTAAVAEVSK